MMFGDFLTVLLEKGKVTINSGWLLKCLFGIFVGWALVNEDWSYFQLYDDNPSYTYSWFPLFWSLFSTPY